MNKLKRTAALLMAAGLSLSMLAGCGTPGQDSTSASPGAEQNATEDTAKGYTYKIATVRWNDTWPTDFLTDGVMGDLAKEADIDIDGKSTTPMISVSRRHCCLPVTTCPTLSSVPAVSAIPTSCRTRKSFWSSPI